jgi:methylenetetrahydrofolate dehydrogenase (NADP+)/methenyltetrahydrofolate cyclohydrolase/formyltetrahydrofolate synthetase
MKSAKKITALSPVPDDLTIAQSVEPQPIGVIAEAAGVHESELIPYGKTKAKISLDVLKRLQGQKHGKYVVVVGVSPTPLGEGKSTTTIGLAQAFSAHFGRKCIACIRQPSQGPVFGIKGGAAGGGYSQVIPMEEFNLHGTGDIHAVGAANNLLAAAIDTRIFHEKSQNDVNLYRRLTDELQSFTPAMLTRLKKLGIDKTDPKSLTPEEQRRFARLDIDPATITWRRCVDINDRHLREITIGQGKEEKGWTRTTGFEITVASEVMAILALASDLADLRRRLGAIQVARSFAGDVITAEDLGVAGAMAVLMKDAIQPTMMQTLEGTPVLVHAGPFGNIAHGNSSIIADKIALPLVGDGGFVVTEAGFGADMGGEKFFDIKCRASGLKPDCAVIVCTIRALKFHGGVDPSVANHQNLEALRVGTSNLIKHIQNLRKFQIPVVVTLNRFTFDTEEEIALVRELAIKEGGAHDLVVCTHWAHGGAGAVAACAAIVEATAGKESQFQYLYPDEMPLKQKIETICKEIYGAAAVNFEGDTEKRLAEYEASGCHKFPICMAKTQYSLSHDPALKGAPSGFTVPVREVRVSRGAGFVFPLLGTISTMPGLPTRPAYYGIDIDLETGKIIGLS